MAGYKSKEMKKWVKDFFPFKEPARRSSSWLTLAFHELVNLLQSSAQCQSLTCSIFSLAIRLELNLHRKLGPLQRLFRTLTTWPPASSASSSSRWSPNWIAQLNRYDQLVCSILRILCAKHLKWNWFALPVNWAWEGDRGIAVGLFQVKQQRDIRQVLGTGIRTHVF